MAIVVECDRKASLLVGVEERATLSSGFFHFTLDTYLIMLCLARRYQVPFFSL